MASWEVIVTTIVYSALLLVCGFGWGQWWAERTVREERRELESGRIVVSAPARAEDAAASLELLAEIVRKVERDRDQTWQATPHEPLPKRQ